MLFNTASSYHQMLEIEFDKISGVVIDTVVQIQKINTSLINACNLHICKPGQRSNTHSLLSKGLGHWPAHMLHCKALRRETTEQIYQDQCSQPIVIELAV